MEKVKILVVEDQSIVAKNIQMRLNDMGYDVPVIAFSGEEAVKITEEIQPDLVLMDIVLKRETEGIEAANQIRTRFNIPVVYLTAYADEKRLEQTKATEPFGYIIKPFEDRELHTTIQMALHRHKLERELRDSEEKFKSIFEESPIGIGLYSSQGQLLNANKSCLNIFGLSFITETRDCRLFVDLKVPDDAKDKLSKGEMVRYEIPFDFDKAKKQKLFQTSKSRIIYLDLQITPFGLEEKESPEGYLVQIQDITERKRIEEVKRKAYEQAEENIERFAILVDGIRNPLAVIAGFSELKKDQTSEKVKQQVKRIVKILKQLDQGWLESEKIRKFLRNY